MDYLVINVETLQNANRSFSGYVTVYRSPSIPLKKGEEENPPPFLRGAGGIFSN
jgi:hypothetical protein